MKGKRKFPQHLFAGPLKIINTYLFQYLNSLNESLEPLY